MQFQYSPYILPLAVSAIFSGWVAVYVWERRRATSGADALAVMALAVTLWSIGYALEIAGADLPTKIFWGKSQYLGITAIPLLWVIFAFHHSNQGDWITPRNVTLLSVVPFITLILAFTTESHGLIWKDIRIETIGRFSALNVTHGYWFWFYWLFSNILILLGTIVIFRSIGWMKGLIRRQNVALLVAVLAPWAGNLIYASGLGPIPYMDITPFAFTISVVATTWGIMGFQLVNISPVARGIVVENMQDGMLVLDTQGNIADINLTAQKMIGISASKAIGQRAADVLSAWPSLVEQYGNVLESQDEILLGEGESQNWYELRLSPLYDSHEHLIGRIVTVRNITERKRVEAMLHENEARYRQLIENASDVIYRTDVNGRFIYANPIALHIMGFATEAEVLGKHYLELASPAWRHQMARFYGRQFVAGELNTYFEFPAITTDGREVWFGQNVQIIRDGGKIVGFQAVARDITERKQAEAKIQQLSQAVEASPTSIVITDIKGDIQYVNPKFNEVTGYSTQEVLGKNPRILKSNQTPPETHHQLWEALTAKREWTGEFCNRKKNGELYWELASISPILDSLGNTTHFVAVKEDITERKQAEQELAIARDQALEASRLKSQFLAKMSHEFRTPLGGILGYAELLHSNAFGALKEEQQRAVSYVIENAHYLTAMVNELLDEAQIESNTIRLRPEIFSVRAMLSKINPSMVVLAENKGLKIITSVAPDLPDALVGDENRLRQVVINLLGNAIKFTKEGEIRLNLFRPDSAHWALQVADTGVGIPKEAQSYIFDSFRQVDTSLTGDHRGTGLGLSIAKQLVELMGGQITLESEVGRGSIFTVMLPMMENQEKAS